MKEVSLKEIQTNLKGHSKMNFSFYDYILLKSLFLKLSILLVFLSFFSCSNQNFDNENTTQSFNTENSDSIVGGQLATDTFQKQNGIVQLELDMGFAGKATCTGTLIDNDIILTAAHCVADPSLVRIKAIFGLSDIRNNKNIIIPVVSAIIHPEFNPDISTDQSGWSDIALLKLKTLAPKNINKVKLPSVVQKNLVKVDSLLTLAGYGITNAVIRKEVINSNGQTTIVNLPGKGAGVLRLVNNIKVLKLNENLSEILLDQTKSVGACHGDSGGPAFLTMSDQSLIQVGLTSRGTEALGNCNKEAIYTNLEFHLKWILQGIDKLHSPNRPISAR